MGETECQRLAEESTMTSTARANQHSKKGSDESTYKLGSSGSNEGVNVLVVLLAVVMFSATLLLAALILFCRYVVRANSEQTTPKDVSV